MPLTDDIPAPFSHNLPIAPSSPSASALKQTPVYSWRSSVVLFKQLTRLSSAENLDPRHSHPNVSSTSIESHSAPREFSVWPLMKPEASEERGGRISAGVGDDCAATERAGMVAPALPATSRFTGVMHLGTGPNQNWAGTKCHSCAQ